MSHGVTKTAEAQELALSGSDGRPVAAGNLRGRVVVLMFSGIQDPQCRDEIKSLESLAERYQNKPVSIYWVSINSTAELSDDKLKRPCGLTTSIAGLRLSDVNALKRMSGRNAALPTVIILDKAGQPYGQPRSGFNPNSDFVNDIADLVDSLLARK